MESTAKELLEHAYGKPISEAEFQAMASNLSTFFGLLHKKKTEKEKQTNDI